MAKKDLTKNYAQDREFAEEFCNARREEWNLLRHDRSYMELKWLEYYDQWALGDRDPNLKRNYLGKANLKLPQLRKEVETMTRRLQKAMFPEDYLTADQDQFVEDEMALVATQVVRHYFDNVMNLKAKSLPWLKQSVLYGTSPMRVFWHKEVNEMIYKKRAFKEGPQGQLIPDFKTVMEECTIYNAPKVRTEDMFQVWVYPQTANDPSEVQRVYFRTKVTLEQLMAKIKNGTSVKYTPSQLEAQLKLSKEKLAELKDQGKDRDTAFDMQQQRLIALGESGVLFGKSDNKLYDLLEVWGKDEIDGEMVPYVCEIVNETFPIRIQRNPLWHQSFPFIFGRFIQGPGNEFYGRGLPEAVSSLQHQLNDTVNQGMDSVNMNLNTITIVNPAYAPNLESFEIEPGAIWWADPAAVKPFQFPDLSDTYLKNASSLRQAITELSDNTPQLPDPISGKARSTGQAQLAINEWQTDLYSFVDLYILESFEPLCKQTYSLLQQNIPDDAIVRITGKYADSWINRVVTPEDIVGNYNFKWLGAIQVENQSVKTQQMLNFLKIWPMVPQSANVQIKWDNLIIKLLREGFQIRDVQNIISSSQMSASIPPYIENRVLDQGGYVEVCLQDDDDLHEREHMLGKDKSKDVYVRAMYDKHILMHRAQKQKKAQQAQMIQQQIAEQKKMQLMEHMGGKGKPPANPGAKNPLQNGPGNSGMVSNPSGNQGQISQATDPANLARGLR